MCDSIFFRKVGRAMMKKENKKTEPDVKNNDRQKEKKSVKLGSMAPALSAILVVACAGASVAAYTPKVYAVQKAAPKATESDTVEDTTAEEMNLEGQVFDLPDGIYEGTGTGFAGKITVAVEIKDKKIVAITILNVEADDAAFFNRAKGVIDRIIQSQNLDVVKNALTGEKDSGKTAENPGQGQGSTTLAASMDAGSYKDGVYYGSATGFAGPIKVKVVITDGKIASVEIVETSDGSSYISKASSITGKIVASQSTNVDTVSGATYSSVGIINAVRNALAQAAVNPGEGGQQDLIVPELPEQKVEDVPAVPTVSGNFPYPDGTYYGTAEGYLGDITVAVVIQNQTIQSVEILSNEDDAAYFDRAKVVANRVVNQQTTGVDTVSGATYSSRGIINAIQAALDAAKSAANPSQPVTPDHGNAGDSGNNGNDNNGNTDNGNDGSDTDKKSVYYADGTYPVTVLCEPDEDEDFEPYHLSASVVIKNDRVAEINNVTGDGDSGNNSYIKRAVNGTSGMTGMVSRIIGMAVIDMSGENAGAQVDQNLTEMDTVSRATCTSKSIKEACREALRQAREKFLAETESARNEDREDSAE